MSIVISVEHVSKLYDLGVIGTGTLSRDLERWWARVRKQPDPYTRIGQKDAFESIGQSILALDNVSFTVQQGEALGIIGRNGAGKSTILKILSRVTAPTSGVVKVKGRIGSLLEVGTGFHPELTGRENVYLNGAILGMKKTDVNRKFDEIVSFAGIDKFIDTPVKRYSSGMYVRLAFAVAAHLESEILLVDEVLAVGDAEFQKKCLGKMGDVANNEGRTVLFVSHNLGSMKTLCENGFVIDKGLIVKGPEKMDDVLDFYNKGVSEYITTKNLRERKDRKGTGKLIITSYELLNENNDKIDRITCGDFVRIRLHYHAHEIIDRVSVTISLGESVGDNKLLLWSESKKQFLTSREGEGIFDCVIPKFPLTSGSYLLNIYISSDGNILDWIRDVGYVDVDDGDFFQIMNFPHYHQKVALVDHWWE